MEGKEKCRGREELRDFKKRKKESENRGKGERVTSGKNKTTTKQGKRNLSKNE